MTEDQYAQEDETRNTVRATAVLHGYDIETYALADKAETRTLTVALFELSGDMKPAILCDFADTFRGHGYEIESAKLVIRAKKDVTNQIPLPFPDDKDVAE